MEKSTTPEMNGADKNIDPNSPDIKNITGSIENNRGIMNFLLAISDEDLRRPQLIKNYTPPTGVLKISDEDFR